MIRRITWLLLMAAMVGNAWALELNRTFTDDMVLQRDKPVTIKGTADEGASVTVDFAGRQKATKADASGNWAVALEPMQANGKAQKLTASSKGKTVAIDNVVVGDVILHARQTSIDITLGKDEEGSKVAAATKPNPMFRAISIKTILSAKPRYDLVKEATPGWRVVDKESALKMTDSAYYLGRELAKSTDVPIGIIDVNLDSAFANSWFSREELLVTGRYPDDISVAKAVTSYETLLDAELKGEPVGNKKVIPKNTLRDPLYPTAGHNGTLYPLAGTALKAAVVQLGNDYPYMLYQELLESDDPSDYEAHHHAYKETYLLRKNGFRMEDKVVPRVPRAWRESLGDKDLPFGLIVPPGSDLNTLGQHHREMRELQRLVAEDTPGSGIILPGTEHIPLSAQPADGALLGKRCLSWIEGAVYAKADVPATGPMFDHFDASFNEATITFKEGTATGLRAMGDALEFFEVANVEGDYYPAEATIDGDTIRIESDAVGRIARVRYNWNQKPNQGLVNAADLPAIPFRSTKEEYEWFVRNEDDDLPDEYFTSANEWKKSDVTLISGAMFRKGYSNFAGWIGPAGFKVGPFGPNMGVMEIRTGSPADGKLLEGDVIYGANGKMLGEKPWMVIANAIADSETRQGNGRLVLGVRRGAENIEVELTLEVMGTYSTTAPYDCPKTEKIVNNLAKWIVSGKSKKARKPDFLGTDTLFLLATGNPEYLGIVRRAIYDKIGNTEILDEIDPTKSPKAWYPAWDSLVLGEYYMATGDRNVLPYLKFNCDLLAAKQHPKGGWRHNFPGGDGYGLMPALGEAAAIGFHLANDAGLDISQEAYRKVVKMYHDNSGEMGRIVYTVGGGYTDAPREFEPEQMKNGLMSTGNGALGSAAVLYDLEGDTKTAHLCSLISAHAWNNTFEGHGGNFWNNFWTPLGAKVQGKKSFINFWKNYRWYRELGRTYDGAFNFDAHKDCAGFGIPLVAPRERLQIVGAPPSPFAANAPAMLKPALAVYWQKDYAGCEKLVNDLLTGSTVGLDDLPTVEYLARAAMEMQQSIEADLTHMQTLVDAGELWEAKTFLAGLQGVLPDGDARVTALQAKLADVPPPPKRKPSKETESEEEPRKWFCLVTDSQFASPPRGQSERYQELVNSGWSRVEVPEGVERLSQANTWKINVVEDMNQAPEGWSETTFDDSKWLGVILPTTWRMYHTALLRTRFNVDDKDQFDALRLNSWVTRQQAIEIYLNGEMIGKINGAGKTDTLQEEFKAVALKHLKNGENTLAIKTRHNWRWGYGALKVYNDGYDFNLDARLKQE